MDNALFILAIDTSLGGCSVAVLRDNAILAYCQADSAGQQSRMLVPLIESALAQAAIGYTELTAVATTIGPGGFTGIRVGLSTARAIALSAGLPLIGLTTLAVMASKPNGAGDVVPVIDAYRGQWYAQRFHADGTAASEALLLDEHGVAALAQGATLSRLQADASDVAKLAAARWVQGKRDFPTAPLYIRAPDAKLPQNAGLKVGGESL